MDGWVAGRVISGKMVEQGERLVKKAWILGCMNAWIMDGWMIG